MKQKKPRRRKPAPRDDPWAHRTWQEVATLFNQRSEKKLGLSRVMQIGNEAMRKLREAVGA